VQCAEATRPAELVEGGIDGETSLLLAALVLHVDHAGQFVHPAELSAASRKVEEGIHAAAIEGTNFIFDVHHTGFFVFPTKSSLATTKIKYRDRFTVLMLASQCLHIYHPWQLVSGAESSHFTSGIIENR
jgi:hypothetical protein